MLIGICGTLCAGRRTVASFLEQNYGFMVVERAIDLPVDVSLWRSDVRVAIAHFEPEDAIQTGLLKRPYFLLIHVDAPLIARFCRAHEIRIIPFDMTLHKFIECYHDCTLRHDNHQGMALAELVRNARLYILNDASDMGEFLIQLREIDFLADERLRPGWDSYFMALASLAAERTNCMKRRVGCVIARDKRVVATGYNGTPSGVANCCDGGCPRCNGEASQGTKLDLCLCLHAEENAIIEAGRERCQGATLYSNLFPCTLCAKKIVQAGIIRIVFNAEYATDVAARALLYAGGVKIQPFENQCLATSVQGVLAAQR